jgi:anti-sigma regulatory factor (Ser/Thr protein kinase)
LSEFKAAQLEMAVDEACANVIEHSYGGEAAALHNPNHPGLRINLMQCRDRIVVEIFDRGRGFDFDGHMTMDPGAVCGGRAQPRAGHVYHQALCG